MRKYLRWSFLILLCVVVVGGMHFQTSNAFSKVGHHILSNPNGSLHRANPSQGRNVSDDGLWQAVDETQMPATQSERSIIPSSYRVFVVNQEILADVLHWAPMEFTPAAQRAQLVMSLPMPDGTFSRFRIEESPVMAPELAARFPEIKTYNGQGIDNPTAIVRFDRTPAGFHAMVLSAGDTVFVDPYQQGDTTTYISYYRKDYHPETEPFRCLVSDVNPTQSQVSRPIIANVTNGTTLRTYRLALAADGEYTRFHGGTITGALAAMTTTMNRVNGVYGRDLAIRMVMIADEPMIIYLDPSTDPYSNTSPGRLLSENQANLDRVIGSANYDIGHVFTTGGGGVAELGSVCVTNRKAMGVTGLPRPIGDDFDIDFVAHEMGHQFGANHPFNGTSGNCGGGNRASEAAYEPGSGSTIMAYAGICNEEDLQPHSDDYFHVKSLEEIVNFISFSNCPARTDTSNKPPVVTAGSGFTIPKGTPFTLTATGSDPDNDAITYCWEEYDLGTPAPPNTDNGNRPIFRSVKPITSPSRTFPQLSDILKSVSTLGESLPTTNRTMNFRVTVRDNRANGGGINMDTTQVTVTADSGPFSIVEFDTPTILEGDSMQEVRWNVANTSSEPIKCANVRISLSTDGGLTFPIVLAASTPNDGSEMVKIPSTATASARFKVEAVGNIFFNISRANFSITTPTNTAPTITASAPVAQQQGSTETTFTLATVSDKETPADALKVRVTTVPTGLAVTQIVNIAGTIKATVKADCAAVPGPNVVVLQVEDGNSATSTANLTVNVTANTPPSLGTYPATTATAGESATVTPGSPPNDNGNVTLTVAVTSGTFTGALAVDSKTGVLTISNAGPVGSAVLTVTATDNCGAKTTQTVNLTVNPSVKISSVDYTKKVLTINGSGFGSSPTVTVNGTVLPASVILSGTTDSKIAAKGKKKKLNLRTGANTIQVTGVAGQKSNVFTLNLASAE